MLWDPLSNYIIVLSSDDGAPLRLSPGAQPSLARWAAEPFACLTAIGRQSGSPHRIEIWFAIENGRVCLLSGGRDRSDWVRNLQANSTLRLSFIS